MKKWFVIAGIIAILIIGTYFLLSFYAVKFIQAQVQKMTGPGFTIAQIRVNVTHLSIQGIRFEDSHTKQTFLQVEEMRIYPDLLSFLRKGLHFRKWAFLRPSFFFYRTREGVFVGPWVPMQKEEKSGETTAKGAKKGKEATSLRIDRLRIEEGAIDFDDMKAGEAQGQIRLRDVELSMENIVYPPISSQSPVELKGKVKGNMKTGEIETKGWVDLKTSDLETSLKIREVELKTFEPYYRKRVSAEVESGHMNIDATVTIKSHKIDAPGHMELGDLRIKGEGTVFYLPAKTLTSLLKDRGNKAKVKFHVKGDMDDPRFNLQETFLTQVAFSLAEAIGLPVKAVGESFSEGSAKGSEGPGGGLRSIEDMLKKKEKKQ